MNTRQQVADEDARAAAGLAGAEARAREAAARLAAFKRSLEAFAARNREEIASNPAFRRDFLAMARAIGVDPLASSHTAVWSSASKHFFDLGVRAASHCIASRAADGGLRALADLTRALVVRGAPPMSEDDVAAALEQLAALGDGFAVVTIGGARYVRSVPEALSTDGTAVLGAAERPPKGGAPSAAAPAAARALGWPLPRAQAALDALVRDGLAWVDAPPGGEKRFYFPALE